MSDKAPGNTQEHYKCVSIERLQQYFASQQHWDVAESSAPLEKDRAMAPVSIYTLHRADCTNNGYGAGCRLCSFAGDLAPIDTSCNKTATKVWRFEGQCNYEQYVPLGTNTRRNVLLHKEARPGDKCKTESAWLSTLQILDIPNI